MKQFEKLSPGHQVLALIVTGAFTLLGLGILLIATLHAMDDAKFLRESIEAQALVVHVESHWTNSTEGGNRTTYTPTFQFTDRQGTVHEVATWYRSSDWDFQPGQEITIRYRPDEPERAVPWGHQTQFMGVGVISLVFFAFGGIFSLIGLWMFVPRFTKWRRIKANKTH